MTQLSSTLIIIRSITLQHKLQYELYFQSIYLSEGKVQKTFIVNIPYEPSQRLQHAVTGIPMFLDIISVISQTHYITFQIILQNQSFEKDNSPSSHIVARQVFTVLSLSWGPSFAIEIITFNKDVGNFSGAICRILRISRREWMRSMSLS